MIRAALLVAVTATTVAAQGFEGSVTMKMTDDKGQANEITYLLKGGKLRFEAPGGRGFAGIMDPSTKKLQVIMTAQRMYMEMDLNAAATAATANAKPPKIVRTGKTETIAGYKCEHVEITGDDGAVTDVCAASGLGAFTMPSMGRGGPPAQQAWQKAMGDNAFPLKVQKGDKVAIEVTKIEKKSLDDALFTVPSDFTNMGNMGRRGGG
jgi:uncharacterized protein DUF4412